MRGQYQVEEHPLEVTLPVSTSAADEAVTSFDEEEHKEEVELKGERNIVGKFNIDMLITDAIFDKEIPSPIPLRIEPHTEDIHLHSLEEPSSSEKVDEVTDKTQSQKIYLRQLNLPSKKLLPTEWWINYQLIN